MEELERFLLVSAIALFIYVFYKWLLQHMRRKDIQGSFPYVFPFDLPITDTIYLAFELPAQALVKVEIRTEGGEVAQLFFEKEFISGKSEVSLSVESLARGKYELVLVFPNQTTRRTVELT